METHADMQVLASETCLKLGEQVAQQGSETSLPPCCWGYHLYPLVLFTFGSLLHCKHTLPQPSSP